MKKILFIVGLIGLIHFQLFSQNSIENTQPGKQIEIAGSYSDGIIDGYLLYLPKSFTEQKSWPLIIFLQGGAGVGGKITQVVSWGLPKLLSNDNLTGNVKEYVMDSFIVVCPHMTDGEFEDRQWYNQEKGIQEIMDEVIKSYNGDPSRVYLTGLCRGGAGTWGLASRIPDKFAAIVPLCGVTTGVTNPKNLVNLPIWVAHSDKDKVIDYSESLNMVNKVETLGDVKFLRLNTPSAYKYNYLDNKYIFTTFDRESHDAWSGIYDRVEVYKWMLTYKNKNAL